MREDPKFQCSCVVCPCEYPVFNENVFCQKCTIGYHVLVDLGRDPGESD